MKRSTNRRNFLRNITFSSVITASLPLTFIACEEKQSTATSTLPLVISTWKNIPASEKAMEVLRKSGHLMDAVVEGIMITENNPNDQSVGYGGRPDNSGRVTLDASVMDHNGNAGAVACISKFKNPIAIARKVMEDTPHVLLVGEGADNFARDTGFPEMKLLTDISRKDYEKWLVNRQYKMEINIENHDTIGMIVMNDKGTLSGGCSTSGAAFKMPGRVGDSPIIGAGLFIDDEIGGAVATGLGEEVLKTLGSFLVVEQMRQGKNPEEACKFAIERIIRKNDKYREFQVAFLAVKKDGSYGGFSIQPGFVYTISGVSGTQIISAPSYIS